MDYIVICLVSLSVAGLTLFSGFGLGTLLLPAFAFFFPIEVAVAATAVVHLANNLLKLALVGRMASWPVVIRFTVPALITSALGALLLAQLGQIPPFAEYQLGDRFFRIEPVKLTLGALIGFFAIWELVPRLSKLSIPAKYIPLGGALSGFFGGLSGMQGALRSLFLLRAGLSKEQFIGTGVVAAVLVDLSRLAVYGSSMLGDHFAQLQRQGAVQLVIAGTVSALVGTVAGTRLIRKVTMDAVQKIVGWLLIGIAVCLCAGLV